jgi:peptidyl-prolyl cis-trans isomerase-like 4
MVSFEDGFIGSQFFFTLGTELTALDGIHCVFGEVVEGHEVLRTLNEAIVDSKHRPYKDIRITHTVILDDPFSDPRGFRQPSRSPSPTPERLKNGRIGADEDINDTAGKTEAEIQEMIEEREAKARATILEIVGDLPDADCAPPENVLFVCKLNPVTSDDDLQIIFSRFGKIKACEVIRDKQSGDSLQYAFIEFEEQKSCEDAYFKMDNVLIDDRRIHVDFSQSVSKIKWRGKGNYTIYGDDKNSKSDRTKSSGRDKDSNRRNYDSRRENDDNRRYNDSRKRSPERKRKYSPERRKNHSPERKRNYSPERKRKYSPERRKNHSPERRRNYSPEKKRRYSTERKRSNSRDKNKRPRSRDRSRNRSNDRLKRDNSRDRSKRDRSRDRSRRDEKHSKHSRRRSSSNSSNEDRRRKDRRDSKKSSKKSHRRSRSSSRDSHRKKRR